MLRANALNHCPGSSNLMLRSERAGVSKHEARAGSPILRDRRCAPSSGSRRFRRAKSRRAQRTVGRGRIHDVKQRSVVRSRGALLRPGWSLSFRIRPEERGGRSADRRTISVVAFARRDWSARVRRGASHDAGRSPLGAPPWRFSAGGRASISGIASGSVQRAPRSQVVVPGGRCPGQPAHRSETSGDQPLTTANLVARQRFDPLLWSANVR